MLVISLEKQKLSKFNALLQAHNPLNVLNKGYALLQNNENEVISEISNLKNIKEVKITLKDGSARFKLVQFGGILMAKKKESYENMMGRLEEIVDIMDGNEVTLRTNYGYL